ncbi:hypothetical protein IQ277_29210 [Nostocales cyanobacterium LEGE 12452]|nr:hypothetical protein [Nostocales cyanobacterium LEGE 12452]
MALLFGNDGVGGRVIKGIDAFFIYYGATQSDWEPVLWFATYAPEKLGYS